MMIHEAEGEEEEGEDGEEEIEDKEKEGEEYRLVHKTCN